MEVFDKCNIQPRSVHTTISEVMGQTHMGVDADPVNLIFQGLKTSLADYIGMHIATDLSDILFITTANTLPDIPLPLQDRMEIIRLSGYTEYEKLQITKKFLIKKQLE
jgi:hypothetical protein